MYELKIQFKTKEELEAFILGGKSEAVDVKVDAKDVEASEVRQVEEPKSSTRKTKASKKKAEEAKVEVEAQVEAPALKPVETSSGINKQALLASVGSLIEHCQNELKMDGNAIGALIAEVYEQVKAPLGVKIGQLEDHVLAAFVPAFQNRVSQGASGSFI